MLNKHHLKIFVKDRKVRLKAATIFQLFTLGFAICVVCFVKLRFVFILAALMTLTGINTILFLSQNSSLWKIFCNI